MRVSVEVPRFVALAELMAAVSEYEEFVMGPEADDVVDDEQDGRLSRIEDLQLRIARAFLRLCGIAADPSQVYDFLIVPEGFHEAAREVAQAYRKSPIPPDLRWEVFRRDRFTCKECGLQAHLHADHIVPESKGGPTTLENLQTLCRDCNIKKGTRT